MLKRSIIRARSSGNNKQKIGKIHYQEVHPSQLQFLNQIQNQCRQHRLEMVSQDLVADL